MLFTRSGRRAIRFPATDVRVFNSRASTGVRGIRLGEDDAVVSMAVIRHFEASPEERAAYLRMRRAMAGLAEDAETDAEDDAPAASDFTMERYSAMSAAEDLIVTITETGSGKTSSSHDYRVSGRGGQGVAAMDRAMRGGPLVAAFPVEGDDQIMLATSTGQSIRCPVAGISFRSRGAGGVGSSRPAGGARRVRRAGGGSARRPGGEPRRRMTSPCRIGGALLRRTIGLRGRP